MLKVLIADDEKKVCQLIANLVDWESYGFQVTAVVNDGVSAYNYLKEHIVNLLITDIRMPGCDGMELIQKAKVLDPNLSIVIISGYSQFEYAQNAIRFGVEDYLLKPIRKKHLVATLKNIGEKYADELKDATKWQDMQKRLKDNEEKAKRALLEDLIKRPEKFGGFFSAKKINEEYHYQFSKLPYQTFMIKIVTGRQKEAADTRRMLMQKGLEIAEETLKQSCQELVAGVIDGEIYGIINGAQEALDAVLKRLKKVKLDIVRLQDLFEEVHVYISIGSVIPDMQNIRGSFEAARRAMYNRFYLGDYFLLEEGSGESVPDLLKSYINNPFKKRFLNYIEMIDLKGIETEMTGMKESLERSTTKNGMLVLEVYKEILTLFYFGTHNYNITIPEQMNELMGQFEMCGTIEDAMTHLKQYMVTSLTHWMEEKKYVESKPIRMAKQYIAQHYNQLLTLEMVSREIGFNPTYFSGFFKKETGMNFSEYLKKVKVENAKNVLLNTDQSVEEVAYLVGYSDVKYFSRLFKKLTGVTPTEFRKLYN